MIKSLSDAKRLVADMHNSILDSLAQKDTEIKQQAVGLLREIFEEKNYSVTNKGPQLIEFKATQTFQDDWSSSGKRGHTIEREMNFWWQYCDEDSLLCRKGWNIMVTVKRSESYRTDEGYYYEILGFTIDWSTSQKKCLNIHRDRNESKFSPRR